MIHFDWKAAAEGLQARLEERCAADGHHWQELKIDPGVVACYWCHAIQGEDEISAEKDGAPATSCPEVRLEPEEKTGRLELPSGTQSFVRENTLSLDGESEGKPFFALVGSHPLAVDTATAPADDCPDCGTRSVEVETGHWICACFTGYRRAA